MNPPEHAFRIAMRQSAGSAAFGAALLLFFGFYYLAEPSRGDLFGKSAWILYHTLRIGGVLTAAIALWLWTGHRPALVADALLASLIGIVFLLTGLGMLFDGGDVLQVMINAFCGVLFIRAAMCSAHLYRQARTAGESETLANTTPPVQVFEAARGEQLKLNDSEPALPTAAQPPAEGYLAALAKKKTVPHHPPPEGQTGN